MRYEITAPDGRRFEVTAPEGATQDQVLAFAQQSYAKVEPHKPVSATDDMGEGEKLLAGIGKGMVDVGRGIGQRFGAVSKEEVAETRKRDAPLMESGAGAVGNAVGNIATLAPAMFVPGANTVAGATAVGALSGFAQPTAEGESAFQNTATGAALGGASQWGIGKAAEIAGKRLAALKELAAATRAKNAVKDTGIAEARELGYKTVPSVSGGNFAGRVLEGATGKEKAKQLMAVKNQPVTDSIIRKGFDLADDAPLSHETMRTVRAEAAAKGYEPIRQVPLIQTDDAFRGEISKLTSRSDNAAKDFGVLVESDIKPLVEGLREVKAFSGDTAVDAVAIFREKASDLYAQGNKTLGKAYRRAAESIEDQIERALAKEGKDGAAMVKEFRAARTRMAQTFDVEKAIREGQGVVDARVLGKLYDKSPEKLSGAVAQVAKSAAAMPEVMAVPKDGWANPVTALDSGIAAFGGIAAGNPLPLLYPVARAGGRYGLMSDAGQKMFATPRYGPNAAQRAPAKLLEALRQRAAGGMSASAYPFEE